MKQDILNLANAESTYWRFGLVSRYVERQGKYYYIHDTSSGWITAKVTKKQMADLINGKLELLNLNWE